MTGNRAQRLVIEIRREAVGRLRARGLTVRAIAAALAKLAEEHADTPMAGRTHLQHALPVSFGALPDWKKFGACGCCMATPQSNRLTSTYWPLPERARSCSAARMPMAE